LHIILVKAALFQLYQGEQDAFQWYDDEWV